MVRGETRGGGRQEAGQGATLIYGCSISVKTGGQGVGSSSIVCVVGMGESVEVLCEAVVCGIGVGMCYVLVPMVIRLVPYQPSLCRTSSLDSSPYLGLSHQEAGRRRAARGLEVATGSHIRAWWACMFGGSKAETWSGDEEI